MVLKKSLKNGFKLGDKESDERSRLETAAAATPTVVAATTTTDKNRPAVVDEEVASTEGSEYEAPDGGWGWMVTIGLIAVFVSKYIYMCVVVVML